MLTAIAAWRIWTLPRLAIAVLISVELIAVLIPGTNSATIAPRDLGNAALLASLSIAYSAFTLTWEQVRVLLTGNKSRYMCPNLLATWTFTAGVLLPIRLAVLVVVAAAVADWPARNLAGQTSPHRYIYSTAAAMLATVAARVLGAIALPFPFALLLAGAGYIAVGLAMVAIAMVSVGQLSGLRMFLIPRTHLIEVCTVSIGIVEALANLYHVPLVWLSLPAAIGIQRWSRKEALRDLAEYEAPLDEQVWLHVARGLVAGCELAAVIRINTHDPAAVRAATQLQSGCDIVGSFGDGTGLAILLADCPPTHAAALASRLRAAIRQADLSAQVAVASKPRDGGCVEDLLVIAEAELIATGAEADLPNRDRSQF